MRQFLYFVISVVIICMCFWKLQNQGIDKSIYFNVIHVTLFLSMETKKTQAYVHLMSWKGTLIAISRLQLF